MDFATEVAYLQHLQPMANMPGSSSRVIRKVMYLKVRKRFIFQDPFYSMLNCYRYHEIKLFIYSKTKPH